MSQHTPVLHVTSIFLVSIATRPFMLQENRQGQVERTSIQKNFSFFLALALTEHGARTPERRLRSQYPRLSFRLPRPGKLAWRQVGGVFIDATLGGHGRRARTRPDKEPQTLEIHTQTRTRNIGAASLSASCASPTATVKPDNRVERKDPSFHHPCTC
jgi:hypothetical protein